MKTEITSTIHRLQHLAEHCRKRAVGWQSGDTYKRLQRAKYRAYKHAAQIAREAKG